MRPRFYRYAWLLWLGGFLALELTAALNSTPRDTLSENVWLWLGGWWWLLVAGLLVSLVAHFSPKHTSVKPVIAFGALVGARIAWVTWGWWCLLAIPAGLLYLGLRRGEWVCFDKAPHCIHRTRLGALVHQQFRKGRLPWRLP